MGENRQLLESPEYTYFFIRFVGFLVICSATIDRNKHFKVPYTPTFIDLLQFHFVEENKVHSHLLLIRRNGIEVQGISIII